MAEEPVFYVDVSQIRAGKLDEVRAAVKELVQFVEEKEPQLIAYGFYIDEESRQLTVIAVHSGSPSLELHMDVGASEFRKFAGLIELQRIEVYGAVSDAALGRLHSKAKALGGGTVSIHPRCAGFMRS